MSELTTVDKDRRRDELFEELSMGRLTPEAAERIAREEGLEPLQHVPGPTEFDPENEAWWTLPMVVAWIVWRTIDRVRSQFDPYRAAAPYWRTKLVRHLVTQEVVSEDGWWLDYAKPASTLGLVLSEAVLSWLGIGVEGSWGQMIDGARNELSRDPVVWWNIATAGTALFTLILSVNAVGDALRDVLDPRLRIQQ